MIELVGVVFLTVLLTASYFMYARQRTTFDSDQSRSAYHLALGTFMERFTADVQMARTIELDPPSYHLVVVTAAGAERITYTLLSEGIIERQRGPQRQRFDFGKPPRDSGPLKFVIEEVTR